MKVTNKKELLKKIIFILIIAFAVIFWIIRCYNIILSIIELKSRETLHVEFVPLNSMKYPHYGDIIKLPDEKVLALGYMDEPSEIYDYKTNTVSEFEFKDNLRIFGNGLFLGDNKLLLIETCDKSKSQCNEYNDYENNLVVYDLKKEKIINKIKLKYSEKTYIYDYFFLNDNRIAIILLEDRQLKIAIFNPKINQISYSSNNIFSYKYNGFGLQNNPKGFPVNNDEIIIFRGNAPTIKYNIKTDTFTKLNITNMLYYPTYTKFGDKILIVGENSEYYSTSKNNYNLLYDIKKEKVETIPSMPPEKGLFLSGIPKSQINIQINDNLILFAGGIIDGYPFYKIYKTAKLYDIKDNKFIKIQDMNCINHRNKTVKMGDGSILIFNGSGCKNRRKDKDYTIEQFKLHERKK